MCKFASVQVSSIQYPISVPVQVSISIVTETGNWLFTHLHTSTFAHCLHPPRLRPSVSSALSAAGPTLRHAHLDVVKTPIGPIPPLTLRGFLAVWIVSDAMVPPSVQNRNATTERTETSYIDATYLKVASLNGITFVMTIISATIIPTSGISTHQSIRFSHFIISAHFAVRFSES